MRCARRRRRLRLRSSLRSGDYAPGVRVGRWGRSGSGGLRVASTSGIGLEARVLATQVSEFALIGCRDVGRRSTPVHCALRTSLLGRCPLYGW